MVKVITIRDDVYASLYKIKRTKAMSFSEAIEYLVSLENKRKGKRTDMLALAGSFSNDEIDRKLLDKLKRGL
ncbi:MAG: antitoxin VapB family protein [Candidatus Micrarchaeota archaeon]